MRSNQPITICSAAGMVLLAVILVACQTTTQKVKPSMVKRGGLSPTSTPTDVWETELPSIETATPTPVMVQAKNLVPETPATSIPHPTVAPDPLRFVFPESGPAPVSAWRPPLYPAPWALTPADHFYFARPIAADEVNWPLADYRYGGVFFEGEVHTGVDIPAPRDTPVLSAGDGKVVWAGYGLYRGVLGDSSDPYGLAVMIRHDFGYQGLHVYSVYGHLAQIDVARGQHVVTGDILGLVGQTGKVTGPHLHFEVRIGRSDFFNTYNPELWLVPPQGWGIVAMRLMGTAGQEIREQKVFIVSHESGQEWRARSYAKGAVNSDPYYQENLVVSDLPAGWYEVSTSYAGRLYSLNFQIFPGRVSLLSFQGRNGFFIPTVSESGEQFTPFESNSVSNP